MINPRARPGHRKAGAEKGAQGLVALRQKVTAARRAGGGKMSEKTAAEAAIL